MKKTSYKKNVIRDYVSDVTYEVGNNGATTITITMPSAANNLGRTIALFRYSSSTGTVNVNPQAGESIQSITGTVGSTTSIALHGNNGQGVYHYFTAIRVGAIFVWCRI